MVKPVPLADFLRQDRNFDDIAEHFATKVYGGLKGRIRLSVLCRDLDTHLPKKPLRVLDIGAGMGQMGLYLASLGHNVVLCDMSSAMLKKAKRAYMSQATDAWGDVQFLHTSYQYLPNALQNHQIYPVFDVVLCHAVLEWVVKPQALTDLCRSLLVDGGILSLCFYNPASAIYRNLVLGNFNHLKNPKPTDTHTLTPRHPVPYETVMDWFGGDVLLTQSGIRVFFDYAVQKRGGLTIDDEVVQMELLYSQVFPFLHMGRYLHLLWQIKKDVGF